MSSNWENIKKSVKGKLSYATAKIKKYTRLGKAKLGKMNIKNSINNSFEELGVEVYNQISDGTNGDIAKSKKIKSLIAKINQSKQFIKDKNLEIETIKQGPDPHTQI